MITHMKMLSLVLVVLALAACGGGKYKHGVGNCVLKNGEYMVQVNVYRDVGEPDAKGEQVLQAVCLSAHRELAK